MKYVETPDGIVYRLDECTIFERCEEFEMTEKEVAELLFDRTGILIADTIKGEKHGRD